jgi:hypothetical protein
MLLPFPVATLWGLYAFDTMAMMDNNNNKQTEISSE